MSLIKANAVQIGQSPTATQNFTLAVPSSPDGTIKLARGNAGATTQDVISVDASGNVNGLVKSTGSTTARSLANRFADVVNVKDFGAVGDGVTDDTAAIQAAIDSNARNIFFPSGVYQSNPINILNKVDLKLYGSNTTFGSQIRLKQNGSLFSLNNSSNVSFEYLGFLGETFLTNSEGINVILNSNTRIQNCIIYNFKNAGVRMTGTLLSQLSGSIIKDCLFFNNATDGSSAQLDTFYSNDFSYTGNQFGTFLPATLFPYSGVRLDYSSNGYFSNNLIWQCIKGGLFTNSKYNRIVNNRFEESKQIGVTLDQCKYFYFSGNWINDNSTQALGVYDASVFIGVDNSIITGNNVHAWDYPTRNHRDSYSFTNCISNSINNNKTDYADRYYFNLNSGCINNKLDKDIQLSSSSILNGNTTYYVGPAGSNTGAGSNSLYNFNEKNVVTKIYVATTVTPPTGESITLTLQKNGADISSIIISPTQYENSSTTSILYNNNDVLNVKITSSSGMTSFSPRVVISTCTI